MSRNDQRGQAVPQQQRGPQPTPGSHPEPRRPVEPPAVLRAQLTPRATAIMSPLTWITKRRDARALRRAEAGRQRVVHRVELLGPRWHIVDYHLDDPDFLAIGPGGVFQVTVCDHGRAKVQIGGDVVQVNGLRPPYVALAKRDAGRISEQMSAIAGRRIPVIPVLAFLGTGEIVYYGRPPDGCILTSYRDIGRALAAHGQRITPQTVEKLVALAQRVDSGTVGQFLDEASSR